MTFSLVTARDTLPASSGQGWAAAEGVTKTRTAPAAVIILPPRAEVPRWRNPGVDIKELDSFPEIKYELCEKAGRLGPRGSVESALWQKPISSLLWASILHTVRSFRTAIKSRGKSVFFLKLDSYLYS